MKLYFSMVSLKGILLSTSSCLLFFQISDKILFNCGYSLSVCVGLGFITSYKVSINLNNSWLWAILPSGKHSKG